MGEIRGEAVGGADRRDKITGVPELGLGHSTTPAADQVKVIGVFGDVVRGRTVAEVGVTDHPELFEQFQRAVHRGQAQGRRGRLHPVADLLRRGVLQGRHRIEHKTPLRGDSQAARVQRRVQAVT